MRVCVTCIMRWSSAHQLPWCAAPPPPLPLTASPLPPGVCAAPPQQQSRAGARWTRRARAWTPRPRRCCPSLTASCTSPATRPRWRPTCGRCSRRTRCGALPCSTRRAPAGPGPAGAAPARQHLPFVRGRRVPLTSCRVCEGRPRAPWSLHCSASQARTHSRPQSPRQCRVMHEHTLCFHCMPGSALSAPTCPPWVPDALAGCACIGLG